MTWNWEDKFFNSLLRASEHVHKGLGHGVPTCDEQYLRQHLMWNPNMCLPSGHMLGSRTRLDWGKLDAGPREFVDAWKSFHTWHINDRSKIISFLEMGADYVGPGVVGFGARSLYGMVL